ncbi:enhanced serine sensitivity protein SseB C-terminal domain-containing protein [Acinetobacter gerneri]|uniref:Enhanced serine sensitivity protein SseB C-terminal domain-containing protein n=1 Tax=Acinetobacter gerneri TaxID=202952 RepID=A0AAW8JG19_9GAMM|nr:enhanced serine sensitivity protein SseB C-terminal domain-containing protein [Acinetobacter gerneri]MDQ9009200.1 enhanced serine sensitivity protein SseB C-terminal domain-containing protein [Acinetobacter gerneri]MDQ9013304.1 enhanced serine sensitivity protein SseB C-terminal domain-containing protein [Acinetobacter gerneri]MDQ9023479.1 enhanced serine sensitivity protein SseB C-terminal domain-containing protein [Acinetobacter gerneri]MDQ9051976.1 enhanced serine sensitivity protein SseB
MFDIQKEQALEALFTQAAKEPAYRPEFLKQLLDANIYVIGHSNKDTDTPKQIQEMTLTEGSQVQIKSWNKADGSSILPFFTSLKMLQQAIETPDSYLNFNTRAFFELTLGSNLVLNPNGPYSKEFLVPEIEGLLKGDLGMSPKPYEYQESTEVLLSQPSDYPEEMLEQLSKFFKLKSAVQSAYLAQMHDVKRDPEPTLLLGILSKKNVTEEERKQLSREIGQVAYDSLVTKRDVDVYFIDEEDTEGLSRYLLDETTAFYTAKDDPKKGFFARLFS